MIRSFSSYLVCKTIHLLLPLPSDGSSKVYAIFCLETLQTSLSGANLYYWFVSGFGDMDHLASPYLGSFNVLMLEPVVSLSVQFFFVYRIWVLSAKKQWWLCLTICLVG
jgi:hypothetical protein